MILLVAAAAAEPGALVGVVFDEAGRPLAGVEVRAGGETTRSGPDGGFGLVVEPGRVAVELRGPQAWSGQVEVRAGLSTELLVSLGPRPHAEIEAPVAEAVVAEAGPPGQLRGRIVDEAGQPLAGVRLFVRGVAVEAVSDRDGRFSLDLPSGRRDLSAIRAGYATLTEAVELAPGGPTEVAWRMERAGVQLAELTVRAPKLEGGAAAVLDERQEAASVADVLGAEQMSRAGDSDAAAALRRVTGLTVIGGKYVYVRGLGDRYSATLLNGSALPSPEPEKRVVPLDLFPTSLLEAVVIQKTFSPDRPAEFGGGVVEVRTRSIPEEPVLQLSLSGSYDAGTSFTEVDFGAQGPTDWLGFGTGWRALPTELAEASEAEPIKPGGIFSDGGYSAEELEAFGEMIPNRWGLSARTLPPDFGLGATAGGRLPIGAGSLGALGGFVFSNGWGVDEGTKSTWSQGAEGLELKRRTDFRDVQNKIRLGGALSVGATWTGGRADSTTLLMRSSTGQALVYDADDPTGSGDTHNVRLDWEEQQLLYEQIALGQQLGALHLAGRYAFAHADRDEPDRRDYSYNVTDEGLALSQRGSWSEILYTALDDDSHDGGLDLSLELWRAKIQLGGQILSRARSSSTRRFNYQFQGSEGIDLADPIEEVIVPENIGAEEEGDPGYLELEENTSSSDDYRAGQDLQAAYLMADVAWTPRLRSLVGARLERSVQTVSTFEQFDTSLTPVEAELATTDLLPALTLSLGLGSREEPEKMLVRLGYGRTLSRPELRELSQVSYYDYRSGRLLYGNPELERATIDNVDARWEWYPGPGESLSIGAFYKHFDHPIESVVAVSAVSGSVGSFANATSATNLGAELELRKRLDFVAPWLRDVVVAANASFIASTVDLGDTDGNQTSDQRPLQGQSPWVINAQIAYDNPDSHTAVSALYNVFGPRIVEVGTSGIPDSYEEPVHRVDLVASQGLGEHLSLRLKGSNLLDWPVRQTTGGALSEETREGWSLGLSVTVSAW